MSKMTLTVDRFEGEGKAVAVLLAEAGWTVDVPRALLPEGTRAGDVVSFDLRKDDAATRAVARKTAEVQAALKATDDGGDLSL